MEKSFTILEEGLDRAILSWMQELSPQGICVTDTQLRIQGWNSWLQTNSGLAKETLLGQDLLKIFPDLKTRRLDTYFQKALDGEVSVLSVAFHGYLFPFPPLTGNSGFSNMQQTARITPLIEDGEIVGTITVIEDVTEREYQNKRFRKQHQRQELFSWALSHLLESNEPETIVKEIFPRISAHIEVDAYFNYLLDEDGTTLRLNSAGGVSSEIQKKFATMKLGENISGLCALERRAIVVSDLQQSKETKARGAKELGFNACVCQPLVAEGKLIGTLTFATR
ncbi:MAG: GAF domain-containing protein, partial [Verrucomicrobiota bacterium]